MFQFAFYYILERKKGWFLIHLSVSVESNQFSFEQVQYVPLVTFLIIDLTVGCYCKWLFHIINKSTEKKKNKILINVFLFFFNLRLYSTKMKRNSHKSHKMCCQTFSVCHLSNAIDDANTTAHVSVSKDANHVEDLAATFPDLEQRLQVNRACNDCKAPLSRTRRCCGGIVLHLKSGHVCILYTRITVATMLFYWKIQFTLYSAHNSISTHTSQQICWDKLEINEGYYSRKTVLNWILDTVWRVCNGEKPCAYVGAWVS